MSKKDDLLAYIRSQGKISLGELCEWKRDNRIDSANRRARELKAEGLIKIYLKDSEWWYEAIPQASPAYTLAMHESFLASASPLTMASIALYPSSLAVSMETAIS